jgi:putative PIN family toxin of toxin-antitoxin system
MRVVLDANQFISAVLVPVGHPAQILQAWRARRFDLVISPAIIAEIRQVLLYPRLQSKHGWEAERVDAFLAELVATAIIVPDEPAVPVIADDPTDDQYVACALTVGARYIVSGDEHLQKLGEYRGIQIVSPAAFLSLLAEEGEKYTSSK